MRPSSPNSSRHLVVEATPTSRVADVLAQIFLPRPFGDEGYRVTRASSEANIFFTTPDSPIGPLHYSSNTNVLLCYSVRYRNDQLGVMILSGASALPLLVDGRIRESQQELFSRGDRYGLIKEHTLTEVRTPRAKQDRAVGALAFEDFSRLRAVFAAGLRDIQVPPPQLQTNSINLSGVGRGVFPVCSFFSSADNYDLMLSVNRVSRTFRDNPINLTRPEATLGSHPCITL